MCCPSCWDCQQVPTPPLQTALHRPTMSRPITCHCHTDVSRPPPQPGTALGATLPPGPELLSIPPCLLLFPLSLLHAPWGHPLATPPQGRQLLSKASETPNEEPLPILRAVEDRIRALGTEGCGGAARQRTLKWRPRDCKAHSPAGQPGESTLGEEWQNVNGAVSPASVLRNKWPGCLHSTWKGTCSVPDQEETWRGIWRAV